MTTAIEKVYVILSNFEKVFEQPPTEEKNMLMRLCIAEIIVDKGQRVVRFFVRDVPTVHPQFKKLCENRKAPTTGKSLVVVA